VWKRDLPFAETLNEFAIHINFDDRVQVVHEASAVSGFLDATSFVKCRYQSLSNSCIEATPGTQGSRSFRP
jgi:hypothetical protein